MHLKLANHTMSFDRPRVMGVINVTPDSFSDGGQYMLPDQAMQRAEIMVSEGADIVDVGGESTRPGSIEVGVQEELDRVIPVIERISASLDVMVSADTSKPEVMRAAVGAGASLINDIFALRRDGALETMAGLDAGICLMHMQGTPQIMQDAPQYEALPGDIIDFLRQRVAACVAAGVDRNRVLVDPGFGFGKTCEHNLQILEKLAELRVLELPILVGLSRKKLLGDLTGRPTDSRMPAGIAAAVIAVERGASIVRTHDVGPTIDALRVVQAVREQGLEQ